MKSAEVRRRAMTTVRQVRAGMKDSNMSMVAAGVAFYSVLAIFPALIAVVSVYALVADPADVTRQLEPVTRTLPSGAGTLLTDQLREAVDSSHGGLTAGLIFSLLGTLWAASGGINALTNGLSIIFDTTGRRRALRARAMSVVLTLGALVVVIVALALIVVFPAVLGHVGLGSAGRLAAQVLRWVLLLVVVTVGLTILYRITRAGANLPRPTRLGPLTAGVTTAVLVWVVGSVGFTIYVGNFGKYNKTYGSLAAVIVLLLWLYLSAFAVMLGAVVDSRRRYPATGRSKRS